MKSPECSCISSLQRVFADKNLKTKIIIIVIHRIIYYIFIYVQDVSRKAVAKADCVQRDRYIVLYVYCVYSVTLSWCERFSRDGRYIKVCHLFGFVMSRTDQ